MLEAALRSLLDRRVGGITGGKVCDMGDARGDVGLARCLIEFRRETALGFFCNIDNGEGV